MSGLTQTRICGILVSTIKETVHDKMEAITGHTRTEEG